VTASATAAFGAQDSNSQSAADSSKHAVTTTRQASSRSKQSHKMTISTSTVTGTSETTTRTLQNPSTTAPMRIDYFSFIRKWHVGLYRYGLRLTYDIAIPEPGGALREIFAELSPLQSQAGDQFTFNKKYSDITPENYLDLAAQYGAQVSPPPAQATGGFQVAFDFSSAKGVDCTAQFTVQEGLWITHIVLRSALFFGNNAPVGSQVISPPNNVVPTPIVAYPDSNAPQPTLTNASNQNMGDFTVGGNAHVSSWEWDLTNVMSHYTGGQS
jgi:hypothetical protein